MRPADKIRNVIKKTVINVNPQKDQEILNELLQAQAKSARQVTHREIIMNFARTFSRPVTATIIIAAAIFGMYHITRPATAADTQWGKVLKRIAKVDSFHYIKLIIDKNEIRPSREGWYANGKRVERDQAGFTRYDDGKLQKSFSPDNMPMRILPSPSTIDVNIFELMSRGNFTVKNEQLDRQLPDSVGEDFLIYRFPPPEEDKSWLKEVSVTVGRNSLLPVQIKTRYVDGKYYLTIFDYDNDKKPSDFFIAPTPANLSHNSGRVVLDGEETEIALGGIPDIKAIMVRLYDRYSGPPSGVPQHYRSTYRWKNKPLYHADITLVSNDGNRGNTVKSAILYENEGQNCGSAWKTDPDGTNHCTQYTVILRPTDKEGVFDFEFAYRFSNTIKPLRH